MITLSVVLQTAGTYMMKIKAICTMEKVAGVLMAATLIFVRLTQVNLICDKTIENKAEVPMVIVLKILNLCDPSLIIMEQLDTVICYISGF